LKRPFISLVTKMNLAMGLTIVSAIVAITWLNILHFERVYRVSVVRHLETVLADARDGITTGIDLGLRVEAIDNLDAILSRHGQDGALVLHLTDCKGHALEGGSLHSRRDEIIDATARNEQGWEIFSENTVAVGRPVRDALGTCAAILVAALDARSYHATLRDNRDGLQKTAALSLLALLPVVLAPPLIFRRRARALSSMERDLHDLELGRAVEAPHIRSAGDRADDNLILAYEKARPALAAALHAGVFESESAVNGPRR
jgi:hypothetical protein